MTPPSDPEDPSHPDRGRNAERPEILDRIPAFIHVLGGLIDRYRDFAIWLGRQESQILAEELRPVAIRQPIFISGLARSGSTLLHEIICAHSGVATQRSKDYPMLFTPYWWRKATANARPEIPRERPHRDGMMVTGDSPDALEEMVWMAFFPRCHNPSVCNILDTHASHRAFESFYKLHICKLLLAEQARRYAAKANYHVARFGYLLKLFPDARFVIPVRSPETHIASLMRQQCIFSKQQRIDRRSLAFMRRTGHFEFGLDRRPMHLGNGERVRQIEKAWNRGEEVRGLAIYWDMVYGYLGALLQSDDNIRKAAIVVRFDALCGDPEGTLDSIMRHCNLSDPKVIERFSPGIRVPKYYDSGLSLDDLQIIREESEATAKLWGYY